MMSYNLLVLCAIFLFTDAVGFAIKPEIVDIKNGVPVPKLQKGW
jgi:hypothetical protein